jgi:hypothetical protein
MADIAPSGDVARILDAGQNARPHGFLGPGGEGIGAARIEVPENLGCCRCGSRIVRGIGRTVGRHDRRRDRWVDLARTGPLDGLLTRPGGCDGVVDRRMQQGQVSRRLQTGDEVVEHRVDGDLVPAIGGAADFPPPDPLDVGSTPLVDGRANRTEVADELRKFVGLRSFRRQEGAQLGCGSDQPAFGARSQSTRAIISVSDADRQYDRERTGECEALHVHDHLQNCFAIEQKRGT